MNNVAINNRLAVLASYYSEIDELIAIEERILDTYDGMLSQFNNGEGADHIFTGRDNTLASIESLKVDRMEIDHMWNEALISHEQ